MSREASLATVSIEHTTLDARAVGRLAAQEAEARKAGAKRVLIDASRVAAVEPDGIAAMLQWASGLRDAGAPRPVLAGAPRRLVLAVIQTRLQRELDVYRDSDAARHDLGGV